MILILMKEKNNGNKFRAPDGKQPNQAPTNIDFDKHAPVKGKSKNYLASEEGSLYEGGEYVTKSGSEHVQNPLLQKADKAKY